MFCFFHSPEWIHEWTEKQLDLKSCSIGRSAEGTKQSPYKFISVNLSVWSCRSVCLEQNPHTTWLVNTPEAPRCTNTFKDATQDTQLSPVRPLSVRHCVFTCTLFNSLECRHWRPILTLHFSPTYCNIIKVVFFITICTEVNSIKVLTRPQTATRHWIEVRQKQSQFTDCLYPLLSGKKTCTGPSYPPCLISAELGTTSPQLSALPPTPHHQPHLILLPKHMSLTCNHDPGSQDNSEFVG